ncbi:class A beta-lactamase [Marinobacter sp.]|uniref:class A beta-lactamase n=1 Tax=Marinobacter sp. TaxID=50741 RepID=UPI00356475EB
MNWVTRLAAGFALTLFIPTVLSGERAGILAAVEQAAIELNARVGFAAYDTGTGQRWELQADERFPVASTFKTLACGALLRRVDQGDERLDSMVSVSREDLVTYSPVTKKAAGGRGMTLAELCEATLSTSDNTAANLILKTLGGPAEVTAFSRILGDEVTRLDRWETELNEATPGDPRDTTTPNAMVNNLWSLLFGDVLSPASRDQLRDWLEGNKVADGLFRAAVPDGWVVADRTGAGGYGARSITAVMWPPERRPIIVALYIAETDASLRQRDEAIAAIGEALVLQFATDL